MTEQQINEEFRSIISHALLGYEDNVSKEDWNLVFDGCTKFATKLAKQKCKEQRDLCSHALTTDIPLSPTHNLVLYAPEPNFKNTNQLI